MSRLEPRALLGVALILISVGGVFGVVPTLVVAAALFTIPGYLLVSVIFGAGPMPRTERWTLGIIMSLAVMALGALVLNLTPVGITPDGWLILLGALAGVAVLAMLWRGRLPKVRDEWPVLTRRDAVVLSAATAMSMLAIVIAMQGAFLRVDDGFTQVWIMAEDEDAARLTVESQELRVVTYRIEINLDDTVRTEEIELEPGEDWSIVIDVPDGVTTVEAVLFREGDSSPYRQVRLVV